MLCYAEPVQCHFIVDYNSRISWSFSAQRCNWTTIHWKWWDKRTSKIRHTRTMNEFQMSFYAGSWNPWPRNRKLSDTRWSGKRWRKQYDGIHILLKIKRSWVDLEIRSSTFMIRSIYPYDWMRLKMSLVPRTYSSYGDRTFAAAGPHLWNSLPVQPRNPDISYRLFLRQLKGHLFGNHGHGALWLLICSALEKHLLTYLL